MNDRNSLRAKMVARKKKYFETSAGKRKKYLRSGNSYDTNWAGKIRNNGERTEW